MCETQRAAAFLCHRNLVTALFITPVCMIAQLQHRSYCRRSGSPSPVFLRNVPKTDTQETTNLILNLSTLHFLLLPFAYFTNKEQ